MARAACQKNRPDLALEILLCFAFFLRTMVLLALLVSHIRFSPENGMIIFAILNSKTSRGLQQSLSFHGPKLLKVVSVLLNRARPSTFLYEPSPVVFRRIFLDWWPSLAWNLRNSLPDWRSGATDFHQRTQSLD